eukprot:1139419-Pelagomonas_calceolata.AAC.3
MIRRGEDHLHRRKREEEKHGPGQIGEDGWGREDRREGIREEVRGAAGQVAAVAEVGGKGGACVQSGR